jgi:predicted transcriptional regulator
MGTPEEFNLPSKGCAQRDMNVITLKLPENLHDALKEVSRKRGLSKSTVVGEALEPALLAQGAAAGAAERWLAQWQGR